MNSNNQHHWLPQESALFPSSNTMIAGSPSDAIYSSLPPIAENWDFGWENELFNQPDSYTYPEQTSTPAIETVERNQAVPPQVPEVLSNLRKQVQELRHDILQLRRDTSELQEIYSEKLDTMGNSVAMVLRYVKDLVLWSTEVQENYAKLLEVAERQENRGKGASSPVQGTTT